MSTPRKNTLLWFAFLAFIGFLDASYLSLKHFIGGPVPCLIGGCEQVTTSVYSTIGPVPIALVGALSYLTLLLLAVYAWEHGSEKAFALASWLALGNFLVSVVLVSLQLFVIHAICLYCMASATISTLLCVIGIWVRAFLKPQDRGRQGKKIGDVLLVH